MPYRDALEAATARRDALTRELSSIQERLRDHAPLQERVRELTAEVADAGRLVDQARAQARVTLPLLQSAQIAAPCTERWDRMTGTDQVRFCAGCSKHVYDFTAMRAAEVEDLLRERGDGLCARFYRRADGTIMTSDCEVGQRRRRRRLVVTAVAIAAGALGAAWRLVDREPAEQAMATELRIEAPPVVEAAPAPVVEATPAPVVEAAPARSGPPIRPAVVKPHRHRKLMGDVVYRDTAPSKSLAGDSGDL